MKSNIGKLSDFIEFNPREKLAKGSYAKSIPMSNLLPYTKFIPDYDLSIYNGGTKFRNGDTLVARITPCLENGKTAFVDILDEDEVGFGSTEYIVLRAIPGKTLPDFVFYLAISDWFRSRAIALMNGSSGRQRVQTDKLKEETIEIPSLESQKKIVRILTVLDEKIELNNRQNNFIFRLGQALYENKFDKNDDSEKLELGFFFPVVTGKKDANASSQNGRYPFFTCGKTISKIDGYTFDAGAILLAGNGDFNVKFYRGKFDAYQRTYVLIPNNSKYLGFLYWAIMYNLPKITSDSRGSVVKFITKGNIEKFKIPFEENKYIDVFNSFLNIVEKNNIENEILQNLRDALIPRLMNGDISLENVSV